MLHPADSVTLYDAC